MTRNWIIRCCLVAAAPILTVLVTGSAQLDSNHVDPSSVGARSVVFTVPTTLRAASHAKIDLSQAVSPGYYHFIGVAARLSVGGVRISGESVDFTAAGGLICTAVTDNNGRAACPGDTKVDTSKFTSVPTTFTATFAGDGGLQGRSDAGTLTPIG